MPVRLAVTEGTVADCSQALPLIEGIEAECLLADKAYDTNEIIATVRELGMDPVIPPKSNRREKRDYDRALYKLRHLVENGFLEFKQWRGVATRYAKRTASYLAICQLRAVMVRLRAVVEAGGSDADLALTALHRLYIEHRKLESGQR